MADHLEHLQRSIDQRAAILAVVGLGYVGLPVACLFAEVGFSVIGVDTNHDRVKLINEGTNPMEGDEPGLSQLLVSVVENGRLRATGDYQALGRADVISISVETPVDEDHMPRYVALRSVLQQLGPVLKSGALVIVESTIAPGTMDHMVRPLLEASSGRRAGTDFLLGHCPERVMPGKLLTNLRTMSRVVGGMTDDVANAMRTLYRTIVQADLDTADLLTAEFVKTTENAYRDVNIAFANEVAVLCQTAGADVWRVRELVNKSPGRAMLLPGGGVGGHCIPKDPWLLAATAGETTAATLIPAARAVNDGMPAQVALLVHELLRSAGIDPSTARVAVLGYAYLENSGDTRNSPSEALVQILARSGCDVVIHDPFVAKYATSLQDALRQADCAATMVSHSMYRTLDLQCVAETLRHPLLVDARRVFEPAAMRAAGLVARTLGTGVLHD